MKPRRFLTLLLTVLLCLSVMACGSKAPRSPYAMQWQLDAPQLAEKNGELHFYFMSGEGLQISGGSSESGFGETKWGDSAYDLNPIAGLTCGEVVEVGLDLAKEFGLDEKYIVKKPSDGLTGMSSCFRYRFFARRDSYAWSSISRL